MIIFEKKIPKKLAAHILLFNEFKIMKRAYKKSNYSTKERFSSLRLNFRSLSVPTKGLYICLACTSGLVKLYERNDRSLYGFP